jgi:hypothetical protein
MRRTPLVRIALGWCSPSSGSWWVGAAARRGDVPSRSWELSEAFHLAACLVGAHAAVGGRRPMHRQQQSGGMEAFVQRANLRALKVFYLYRQQRIMKDHEDGSRNPENDQRIGRRQA